MLALIQCLCSCRVSKLPYEPPGSVQNTLIGEKNKSESRKLRHEYS